MKIENLIRRARTRYCLNEAMAQTALVAAVSIACIVLLLIFGTRHLAWWMIVLFAGVSAAFGACCVWRRRPDAYTTAIRVDHSANLHDALSTALFFSGNDEGAEEFRRSQREQAEIAADAVILNQAVPFVVPRAVYAMAALGLLASVIVGLRSHLGLGLNPHSSITEALFQDHVASHPEQESRKSDSKQQMQETQALLARLGAKITDSKLPSEDQEGIDKALDQALQANLPTEDRRRGTRSSDDGRRMLAQGDPVEFAEPEPGTNSSSPAKDSASTGATPSQHEGLLSKLRQAVAKLLPKSNLTEDSSSDAQEIPHQQQGEAKVTGDEPGPGKDKPMPGDSMSAAMQGQANSQAQSGQKGKLTSNEEQKGQGSGIGSQDGLRAHREAEQLKAMGKIVEIIGKRAATVSGEMTVEAQSGGNQRLHTAYTNTAASHGETDGDVTRDEIPLAVQPYVRKYFEQIRKGAITSPAVSPERAAKASVPEPCVETTILTVCP
jgi:hypothetical protein